MSRPQGGWALIAPAAIFLGAACTDLEPRSNTPPTPDPPDVATLHDQLLVLDTHIDVPYRLSRAKEEIDLGSRLDSGHFDFVRAKEGGLDASFFSVYVESGLNAPDTHPQAKGGAFAEAKRIIARIKKTVAQNRTVAELALSPDDVLRIATRNKHAVCMGLENGAAIEKSYRKLAQLFAAGIRYVTLTHSKDNSISDSSYDDRHTHAGLSPFGKDLITEMNRIGMLIDVSHASDDAFWQVLEISKQPVVATHSGLRKFRDFERNMSDDMLRALAKHGGVLHLNFGSYFLSDSVAAALDARKEAFKALRVAAEERLGADVDIFATDDPLIVSEITAIRSAFGAKNATVADVVAQIRYAVDLVGVDHVGYGSDYDGVRDVPVGLEDVSTYPRLTEALLAAGFSKTDIAKISGGNLLRVWRQVLAARRR